MSTTILATDNDFESGVDVDSEQGSIVLSPKDIYLKLASNIELIDLYCNVN
jgi:hypothetical protein